LIILSVTESYLSTGFNLLPCCFEPVQSAVGKLS